MDNFTRQYIITALWSSTNDDGDSLDNFYSIEDIAPETIQSMKSDCNEFYTRVYNYLNKTGNELDNDVADIAHDFWLTRNGHGAGFWDGDYPKVIGEALTKMSNSFGEVSLYVGDDGKIYQG